MRTPARVTSVDALGDFRAALDAFRSDALDALTALDLEVRRSFDWLADQRRFWQKTVRECQDAVTRARAELAQKQMTHPGMRQPDTTREEENLWLAKRRLQVAEEKLETTRRWEPKLQRAVDEYAGPVRHLANVVESDLPKATALMKKLIASLEAYLAQAPPSSGGSAAPAVTQPLGADAPAPPAGSEKPS